jgi:hypothetical protein
MGSRRTIKLPERASNVWFGGARGNRPFRDGLGVGVFRIPLRLR